VLHHSLSHPLADAYPRWLPFRRYHHPNEEQLSLLVTADGRHPFWTPNELKVAAEQTLGIRMQWHPTGFACLPTSDRDRPASQVQITHLQITGFLDA
jgi:hypothetical protein